MRETRFAGLFRLIPAKIKTIEELELPTSLHQIKNTSGGLVLMTGPTGQGKTTTLASIINEINLEQQKHIITIEDPIEYVFPGGKSIVSQREVHQDTLSWRMALRSILREDPDVVLTGEIRDYETAQIVLNIAETGHLVFSTLHTISAPETIDRLIGMFPADQQNHCQDATCLHIKSGYYSKTFTKSANERKNSCSRTTSQHQSSSINNKRR